MAMCDTNQTTNNEQHRLLYHWMYWHSRLCKFKRGIHRSIFCQLFITCDW